MLKKNTVYILLILIPAFFAFLSFFKNLHLVWGDAPYLYPAELKEIVSGLPLWTEAGIDFGGRSLALWLSPIMIIYGSLYKYLGLNNDLIIRIVFYFPAVILAGLGPYFLTKYLKLSGKVQFFSSLIYLLNTYFLLLVDGGQVGVALSYGLFPLTLLFWKKLFDKSSVNSFLLALIFSFVLFLLDPRVAIIAFLVLFLWQIFEAISEKKILPIKNLIWLIAGGILLIPLNLFWILPLLKAGVGNLSIAVSDLQLTSLLNTLLICSPNWPANSFGKVIQPYFYFSLVPILIFGGLIFKKTDKKIITFASLFLIFAFIAKGTTPPFGFLYQYLITKIPLGSIFRDSTKFFIPPILFGGILIGNTLNLISRFLKSKTLKMLFFGVFYLYILLLISPALIGKMNFNLSAGNDNPDSQIIADRLSVEDGDFRTLWFNEKPQIAYENSNIPADSANQLASFRPFAAINIGEDPYNFLNNSGFVNWLRVFGIKYLIMWGDSRNIYPTQTDTKNWSMENSLVASASGLFKSSWGTQVPIYKIQDPRPNAYSLKTLGLVVGSDIVPGKDVPGVAYAEDGKFDPSILQNVSSDSLKIVLNLGNANDLAMSFLQKYFKSASGADSLQWSVFGADQYLKYKYELLTRNYKFNDFDYGRGIAFSTKTGEKINFSFDVPKDGNYEIAVRTADLSNQKLSWTLEKENLDTGKFNYEVVNSGNLTVFNVIALVPEDEFASANGLAQKYISKFGVSDIGNIDDTWHPVTLENMSALDKTYQIDAKDNWLVYSQNFDAVWNADEAPHDLTVGVSSPRASSGAESLRSENTSLTDRLTSGVFAKGDKSNVHVPVFSTINGFYTRGSPDITVSYVDQKYEKLGVGISLGSILVLLVSYLAYAILARKR